MKTSFALCSLVVLLAASVSAQDYAIKLDQPFKVGQRYSLTATGTESSDMTMSSAQCTPQSQKENQVVEMESVVTVLAADAQGRPTKESHEIVKLLQGAEKQPLLAVGTKVIASHPGRKTVFEIEDAPASGKVAKALALVVNITSGGSTDDDIFGTTERKKAGDSWPINETVAMKDANGKLASAGMNVTGVKGTTTLVNVTQAGGVDVSHIKATLNAAATPASGGPFTTGNTTLNATFTGAIPTDITKIAREDTETMNMVMKVSGKHGSDGPVMQMNLTAKRSVTRKFKLIN